ncbi:hypothetical protein AB0F18_19740 [Streptomyces sp. NPDC029216]|uniref:hypothetical protein n=1 Tax=Streptomyces sp. NPDC029216 TaxID=3154701 RepID=UPI0033DE3443
MTRSPLRRPSAVTPLLLCAAAALAAGGCAAPGGLAAGEPVTPASPQPQPQPLWPAWAENSPKAPGVAAGTRQPPPAPLADGPEVGPGGLTGVKAEDVAAADPRMRLFADKGTINGPGRSGLRPPVWLDLTGDGQKELIVAADTETGRTALSVYTARGKRIVPVLFTIGRRMAAEALGGRGPADPHRPGRRLRAGRPLPLGRRADDGGQRGAALQQDPPRPCSEHAGYGRRRRGRPVRALPARCRRLLRALGLRWKIAALLASGCALVAVTSTGLGLTIAFGQAQVIGAGCACGTRPPGARRRR